jgi:hypothetical protein
MVDDEREKNSIYVEIQKTLQSIENQLTIQIISFEGHQESDKFVHQSVRGDLDFNISNHILSYFQ